MGFFDKIKSGLSKTREVFTDQIESIFSGFSKADEEFFEELEETLILSDLGAVTACEAVTRLREYAKSESVKDGGILKEKLREILVSMMSAGDTALNINTKPSVILVIGVNGVGKTTTIGKLTSLLKTQGKRVLLCAGDTFRAAAADQLEIWAHRSNCDIIRQGEGADPASVVFDAITAAKARGVDVIICDTAGRLHNKQNLMNELSKISRIIDRELPDCDRETLLVLDATTGQNGLIQAKQFKQAAGVTGIVITKLDGTAKGGIAVAVAKELNIPVKLVGVGEGQDDLLAFETEAFIDALL